MQKIMEEVFPATVVVHIWWCMIASLEDRILQRCNQTLSLIHPRCRCEISSTETADAKVHDSTILTVLDPNFMTQLLGGVFLLSKSTKRGEKKERTKHWNMKSQFFSSVPSLTIDHDSMIWLKSEQKMIEVHQSAAFWI
jgi:hypothetical protein